MASHQQARKRSTKGQEEGGQAQGHGATGQQGQAAMNLEEVGKYRAEAQQHSIDVIRSAEERFNKANQARAHGTVTVSQAPGATVISHEVDTKKQPPKQQEESHGGGDGGHAGTTEPQQWLADVASDARERCNRATGIGTSPTAAHGGKGAATQSHTGATAALRGKETKKSATEQEGGHPQAQLTRQKEVGHGREAHKVSDAEAARAAVEKHDRSKQAGATAGKQSAKDTPSHALGATVEHAATRGSTAKDAGAGRGARAAAEKTQQDATEQGTGTAVDYTKQTAWKVKDVTAGAARTTTDYAKQAAAKTKDVTLAAGGTTAEYAKQAAMKTKDATVSTGGTAAEYAKAAAGKAKEATEQTTGTAVDFTKQTAWKVKDVTASAAQTTTDYAKHAAAKTKDVTVAVGGTTAEYAKQAAVKAKDAAVSTGGTAAEYAKQAAVKAKDAGVATAKTTAGYTQQAAVKAKDVTVSTGAQVAQKAKEVTADTALKVAEYAKEKAEQGKEAAARAADQAEEPGCDATAKAKDTAHSARARDVTGRQREDTSSGDAAHRAAGGTAEQAKHGASSGTGGATATAKAGNNGEEEEDTTIVGDVLEAVGATVVGLSQHTKGIVAGEEEVIPGDDVEAKVAGAKEEKRKTA